MEPTTFSFNSPLLIKLLNFLSPLIAYIHILQYIFYKNLRKLGTGVIQVIVRAGYSFLFILSLSKAGGSKICQSGMFGTRLGLIGG